MPQHGAIEAGGGTVLWVDRPGGVRLRAARWPGAGRGTVLLLNGRTEFMERWAETVACLRARGFAVWSLDWRGQGGSSRLLPDPAVNHVESFDDHLHDLDALLDGFVLPGLERPLVLLAHSMGGHLGAHLLARRTEFSRAVLCAPMIGVKLPRRVPRRLVHGLVRLLCLQPGRAARFGPGTPRGPDLNRPVEQSLLTSCAARHAADLTMLRSNPALVTGGASWGWLRAAMNSIAALGRPEVLRRITVPVLVLLAGDDRLVDNAAARHFAQRLAHGTVVELPGARHELLREQDRHRLAAWAAVDAFLGVTAAPSPVCSLPGEAMADVSGDAVPRTGQDSGPA